jgi:hypothetical protein
MVVKEMGRHILERNSDALPGKQFPSMVGSFATVHRHPPNPHPLDACYYLVVDEPPLR